MNLDKGRLLRVIFSLVVVLVGIYLIYFAYGRPCEVGPITQTVQGQVVTIENPPEMNRLVCLSTDKVALIFVLIGAAMVFPGVSGLFRSIVGEKK